VRKNELAFDLQQAQLHDYILKLTKEKESLIANFLVETGLNPSDVCIVERATETGRVFYPDLKSKHFYEGKVSETVGLPDEPSQEASNEEK
jgi:hypothetical protein